MPFITMSYMSAALGRDVCVRVILPSGGINGAWETPYKTLYFLPGYSASAMQLITTLGLTNQAELKGIAVVLPDGENLFYQDIPDTVTFYSIYVGKELVEMTRKLLPLSQKWEDTYMGGISMGGYGALYNGMKYRDTFSKVISFSPACEPYSLLTEANAPGFSPKQFERLFGEKETYFNSERNVERAWTRKGLSEELKSMRRYPELFLCCGTNDRVVYPVVKKLEEALQAAQIPHVYREEPGDHEIDFWQRMLDPAFSFLAGIEEGTKNRMVIFDERFNECE